MKKQTAAAPDSLRTKRGGKVLPALCHVLGTVLLLAVIAVTVPLTVPRFLGYDVYEVVSGSMEPEIPVGSVIYVGAVDPASLQEGDVIAFVSERAVIAHRVVRNRLLEGELVTKGDANPIEDIAPVPYNAIVGIVTRHIPVVGHFMSLYASRTGKIYLLMIIACGVLLHVLAGRLRDWRRDG